MTFKTDHVYLELAAVAGDVQDGPRVLELPAVAGDVQDGPRVLGISCCGW